MAVLIPTMAACENGSEPDLIPRSVAGHACRIELGMILDAYEAYAETTGTNPTSYDELLQADNALLFDDPSERWPFQTDVNAYTSSNVGTGYCTGYEPGA